MKAIEEKRKAIKELTEEQLLYLKKILVIAKLPQTRRQSTIIKRLNRVILYGIKVKVIQTQKMMIRSQPIKPKKGIEYICSHGYTNIKK